MSEINEVNRKIENLKRYTKDECDQMEKVAKRHVNNADEAERILNDRMDRLKQTFNNEIEQIKHDVKQRKPKPSEPDYVRKERVYAEFVNRVTSPDGPLEQLGNWFKSLFNKLKEIIDTIVRWIIDAVKVAVTAILLGPIGIALHAIVTSIQDIFRSIDSFFS